MTRLGSLSLRNGTAQRRVESVTGRWWFYLILLLLQMLPPFTSEPVSPYQASQVIVAILSGAVVYELAAFFPLFKVIAIVMFSSVFVLKNRASRYFSIYAGIFYVLVAFLQSVAFTEEFGLAVATVNLVMFLVVAATWFLEATVQKSNFESAQLDLSRVWVLPLAFLAFWYPIDLVTMLPDFNPLLFLTSMGGVAFCMMTPAYLAVLVLFYPHVNLATMRVTGFVGAVIAFYNILVNFVIFPELLLWNGILHLPLVLISAYSLVLSFRRGST